MENKKGQLSSLVGIVSTLIVVGLLIGVGLLIVQEFRDQDKLSDTSGTVINETGAWINDTTYTFDSAAGSSTRSFSVTQAVNATDGGAYIIGSGNYTVDADDGTIVGASGRTANYSTCNVSYTYSYGESSWQGVNDSLEALTTVPDLLGLIILVVLVGIILAVLFNSIPMGRVSGA